MIIHLTKKLADKLKLDPAVEAPADALLSWRANYIQEYGRRFVVFMNDASRFTVVVNDAKASKFKELPKLFIENLRKTLAAAGINSEVIDAYIADLGEVKYAKNSDRKKTAQLNKNVELVWWALENIDDDIELAMVANRGVYNTSGMDEVIFPYEKMSELLGRYKLPVYKCLALDLNVRLDLDGKDAIRKLRVPDSITFAQLHKILQAAYEWKDCHLYSFGLFKRWSDNSYAHPDIELVATEADLEINPDAKIMIDIKLSDYIPEYRKILYNYDFGDDWRHFIEVENVIDDCEEKLPILLDGTGNAPPEDVGGAGGFEEFLRVIADPKDEDYEDMKSWAESQWWAPFNFDRVAWRVKEVMI